MSGGLGNLLISLTADTAQARSEIGKAAHQVERDLMEMQVIGTAAGVAIGQVITNIGGAFARAAKDALEFADQINKVSQRTAFSAERLSELKFAADLADVSFSTVTTGLGMFNKVLSDAQKEGGKASDLFKALGVDITQGPQAAFEQFADAINKLPDGETKVAAMRAVFGRAGDSLIPMIAGLDEATEKANKLGLVISQQVAQDAEKFNDAMTVMSTTMQSLALTAMQPLVGWLAEVASGMAEAKAAGNLFKNVLVEIGLLWLSLWGSVAETIGSPMAKAFEDEFNQLRALQKKMNEGGKAAGPAAGKGWDEDAPAPSVKDVQDALNRMGKEKPEKGKKTKKTRDDNLATKQWAEYEEGVQNLAPVIARMNATLAEREALEYKWGETFEGMTVEEIKQWEQRKLAAIDALQEIEEANMRVTAGFDENGRAISKQTKDIKDWAHQMGLSFTSAFEDAVVSGKKFSEVLRGLAQDMLRIAARKMVTEPMGKLFESGLQALGAAIFGGGKASGGPVAGGTTYLVGEKGPELFTPGVGGMITPNHALGGGSSGPTFNVDMRGASVEAVARLERFVMQMDGTMNQRIVSVTADARRRGGSYARGMS